MLTLTKRVAVYVPSTVSGTPSLPAQKIWSTKLAEEFSRLFGGATEIDSIGSWLSGNGELVSEPVKLVYAYAAADEKWTVKLDRVFEIARAIKLSMGQECVAVEVGNKLQLI